jgi:hypothetical protein
MLTEKGIRQMCFVDASYLRLNCKACTDQVIPPHNKSLGVASVAMVFCVLFLVGALSLRSIVLESCTL